MIALPAELMHAQASACLQALLRGLESEPSEQVVIDAAALQRFDSSALAVLLELRRRCLATGKGLAISGLPSRLRDLASLYGIGELLPGA